MRHHVAQPVDACVDVHRTHLHALVLNPLSELFAQLRVFQLPSASEVERVAEEEPVLLDIWPADRRVDRADELDRALAAGGLASNEGVDDLRALKLALLVALSLCGGCHRTRP